MKTGPTLPDEMLGLRPRRRRSRLGNIVGHTGFNVARYHTTHMFGALFPVATAVTFFGWRAAVVIVAVLASTFGATVIWRRIGSGGSTLRPAHTIHLGLLLALMLPATLAAPPTRARPAGWPLLPAAGLLLVGSVWAVGATGGGRVQVVALVYLLLYAAARPVMHGETVLQQRKVVLGDVARAGPTEPRASPDNWRHRAAVPDRDAVRQTSVTDILYEATRSVDRTTYEAAIRDRLPPLEDVVIGATPGGIGTTSAVAAVVGGLFLLYRGLIDYRVPLLIVVSAWTALLLLPVPITTGHYLWAVGRVIDGGWAVAVTFTNFQLLGTPLLFAAFFLAGSPTIRPLSRRPRTIYAALIGPAAAALQLYASPVVGSYVAVAGVGLISPWLDRRFAPSTLVG